MTFYLTTNNEEETLALGRHLGAMLSGGAVVVLDGDLGAGKTHFAKGVAQALGICDTLTSPTFNLVLEYPLPTPSASTPTQQGSLSAQQPPLSAPQSPLSAQLSPLSAPRARESTNLSGQGEDSSQKTGHAAPRLLRHFDLYRLEYEEQLEDLDYFGLIEQQDAVSLVEWGSKFASHMPLDYLLVHITVAGDTPEQRLIQIRAQGPRSQELLEHLEHQTHQTQLTQLTQSAPALEPSAIAAPDASRGETTT